MKLYMKIKNDERGFEMKTLYVRIKTAVNLIGCKAAGRGGFGMNEVLGAAAALIIAAFVIVPGLRAFAVDIIESLGEWWNDNISERIFPAS